jgi:hypothetical protein
LLEEVIVKHLLYTIVVATSIACIAQSASAQKLVVPLRNSRLEVVENYEGFSTIEVAKQRQIYSSMDPTMREDLWSLHIERFLEDHPDLSREQRAVAFEALGIVQSGIFEISRTNPEWMAQVGLPLSQLGDHARAVLTPAMAKMLLLEIVPANHSVGMVGKSDRPHSIHVDGFMTTCDCS